MTFVAHAVMLKFLPTPIRPLLAAALIAASVALQAQRVEDPNAHFWFSHWGDHRVHDRWSLHSEFHIRRSELGGSAQQLLIRPAVNFHLHDKVMLTAGYSYYENYRYGKYPIRFSNWEHHGFLQAQFSNEIGRVRMQHRYRWEHRWMARLVPNGTTGEGDHDGYGTSERFRYRVWVTLPIGSDSPWTLNAYDEIFLSIGGTVPGDRFSQNRISGLLGFSPTKEMTLMAGYLFQTLNRVDAFSGSDVLEANSTLHVVLVYNLGLWKGRAPVVPVEE